MWRHHCGVCGWRSLLKRTGLELGRHGNWTACTRSPVSTDAVTWSGHMMVEAAVVALLVEYSCVDMWLGDVIVVMRSCCCTGAGRFISCTLSQFNACCCCCCSCCCCWYGLCAIYASLCVIDRETHFIVMLWPSQKHTNFRLSYTLPPCKKMLILV